MARRFLSTDRRLGARLRLVFICQALDRDDPVHATTARWVRALAERPDVEHMTVLALRTGRYRKLPSVAVHRFGAKNRVATLTSFYWAVIQSLRTQPHCFLIHQGGPYPLLLLPFKILFRRPIVQWKAHPAITRVMAFYARWCDDLILTSTRASFPMNLRKVRVVGQGVDTEVFTIEPRRREADIIATCRIAPSKRVDEMVRAVVQANRSYGTRYRFAIYGPVLPGDEPYARLVQSTIESLGVKTLVTLKGPVIQDGLPGILNSHRICLNFSKTALDRSVVEAMACGLPVISTNDAVTEAIPSHLRPTLIVRKDDIESQARGIHEVLSMTDQEFDSVGQQMRSLAVENHSLGAFFDRVVEEIAEIL